MPLETPTYVMDLVETNPPGTDAKSQGDNHIRNIKLALKNTFPTATRAFNLRRWAEKEAAFETQAGDRTMLATDDGKLQYFDCSAASRTYNLLTVASAPEGMIVFISRSDADVNNLTIDAAGTETINGATTVVLLAGQQGILYRGATEWEFFYTNRTQGVTKIEVFTASGTYTRKAGCKKVKVRVQGGGASGGGCATTAAGQSSVGSGGSAGGYAEKLINNSALGATETVTVGAAVNGTTNANGTNGNPSSFGAHVTANGGIAGLLGGASGAVLPVSSSAGGTASSGDINCRGGAAEMGIRAVSQGHGGKGGDGHFGGGGAAIDTATTAAGNAAQANSGAGGGGAANGPSQAGTQAGGQGAAGIVIVEEFY